MKPGAPRKQRKIEAQRRAAIGIVRDQGGCIAQAAQRFNVAPEAIAGAILWEALENPYQGAVWWHGPGKVHADEVYGKSAAEHAEDVGLVPAAKDAEQRARRLRRPRDAIIYIAAIMRSHADNYSSIAGIDISGDIGVLCTLYQGGDSQGRARRFVARRNEDPAAMPIAADEMGPWVEQNVAFVRALLPSGAEDSQHQRR